MKYLILSDTHGHINAVCDVAHRENSCDAVIFLGDGLQDMYMLQTMLPNAKIFKVCGNCDFANDAPQRIIMPIGKKRALITHGHLQYVKSGTEHIIKEAKEEKANIVLFGHTHDAINVEIDGIHLFNPGTLSGASQGKSVSYGILEVVKGKIYASIKNL